MSFFGRKSGPRPIADLGLAIGDEWHFVEMDRIPEWADELSRAVAQPEDDRATLRADLEIVARSQAEVAASGAATWVMIRPDAPGRSICTMTYGISSRRDVTPDDFEQELASDEGRREPGVRFDVVRTWQIEIDAGIAVGAYNLIGLSDLVEDAVASQVRTVFGVFPTDSSDIVEIAFTSEEPDQFEDFVAETMAYVASLQVVLER